MQNVKVGDYLVCKQNFYEGDEIGPADGSIVNKLYNRVFRKSIFEKNSKYKVAYIHEAKIPIGGTGGLWNAQIQIKYAIYKTYMIENNNKHIENLSAIQLKALFYSPKELRNEKLKKLQIND